LACLTGGAEASIRVNVVYANQLNISTGSEGIIRPNAVTCDPFHSEIVVTDARQMGIHILNPAGIEVFQTSVFAGVVSPLDASIDAAGRTVYLGRVSGQAHRIGRLNLYGEPDSYLAAVPNDQFDPQHLIATRDGNYLSLDTDSGVLVKNDSRTGAVIWERRIAGEIAAPNGVLNLGRPVEAADGRLAIPGGELHSMVMLNANGELETSFGRFGTSPGRLVFPVAAVFGPEGTLLVLDRMRHKILVYGPDYGFQTEFGSMGGYPGQFYHPIAMAGTSDGRLLVAQGYLGRVQVFNILTEEN
jgi:hypothetical protein